MADTVPPPPDMSPRAVFDRLKEASDLLDLCLSLGKARPLGPVNGPARQLPDCTAKTGPDGG